MRKIFTKCSFCSQKRFINLTLFLLLLPILCLYPEISFAATNLAPSASASASSEYEAHESWASNINDGNLSTVWSPARYSSYPQWCDLNWGSSVTINKVVVYPGGNGSIRSYEIVINGQVVASASGIGTYDTSPKTHTFSAVTTTEVKYRVTSANDSRYAHTSEVEVYGTSDTEDPVISGVTASSITANSATITWTTDEASDSVVNYGETTSYGLQESNSSYVASHSITLTGLKSSTTYHYKVSSTDSSGNTATGEGYTFTTSADGDGEDTTPPTANAGANQTVTVEDTVHFDGSASSDNMGITSYEWDFGDGNSGSGVTTSHIYNDPGTYTVTLTVRDAAGLSDTDTLSVAVDDLPPEGTVPPNLANSASATAQSDYAEHGSYASNINDRDLSTVWSPARYSSYPQWCDLTWNSSVTINKVVIHPGGNGSIQSYEIWINNQKVAEASGIGTYDTSSRTHTFSAVTTTKLRYSVTSYNDARYAHTSEIEVYGGVPSGLVANAGPDQTVTVGTTVYFDGSGSSDDKGITSYEWNFGDSTPSGTGKTTSHIYNTAGTYTVTLTVTDADNNSDTDTLTVTVKTIPGERQPGNLAPDAKATASSYYTAHNSSPSKINNNITDPSEDGSGWSPERGSSYPQWCDLTWDSDQTISQVIVYPSGNGNPHNYNIKTWNSSSSSWITQASGSFSDMYTTSSNAHTFSAVKTAKLRYELTSAYDSRYAYTVELEVYAGEITEEIGIISGKVTQTDGTSPASGVTVEISQDGVVKGTDYTDSNGNYEIKGLSSGTYDVEASLEADFTSSVFQTVSLTSSATVNFSLSHNIEFSSISGFVSQTGTDLPIPKAVVEVIKQGKIVGKATSNDRGNYVISNLAPGQYIAKARTKFSHSIPRKIKIAPGDKLEGMNFSLEAMPENQVYNYPNPAKKGRTTIRFYLTYQNPEAEIEIYNIAGELVKAVDNNSIGETTEIGIYEYEWDCTNDDGDKVASGVYIYRIEAKDTITGNEEAVTKKLAVIR